MQKIKMIIGIIIFIIVLNIMNPIYADDELEETSITLEEMEQIIEATSNIEEIPIINSRNAVIYDRTSRKSIIWKTRKQKMQNGIYN